LAERAERGGQELAVYGVPKTIDNDLVGTDHCPGYGSAARYWATVTQEATRDLSAMRTYDRVLVLECAGRNAGWLTAATALYRRDERDGPHVLLLPELPFETERLMSVVDETLRRVGYCVVAAAETIRDGAGEYVAQSQAGVDRFGHPIVTAVGETLAQRVATSLGVKARANKPGTLQRTSAVHVSPVDREEAYGAGHAAAERLAQGESGAMVSLVRRSDDPYTCEFGAASLAEVANGERRLPPESVMTNAGLATGISDTFERYAAPLLGPAPEPLYWLA
jgi:6-phosphofructokinase 1